MQNTILIIDDVEINRDILTDILEEEYDILTASDGIEGMEIINREKDNLVAVLLDLVMPNMDGYEVLDALKETEFMLTIPVLVISTEESSVSERECFAAGVSDFIHKPFSRDVIRARVNNTVNLYLYKRHLEQTVEEQTQIIKNRSDGMVLLLAGLVETRDIESGSHVKRVQGYTRILAKRLGYKYPRYGLNDEKIEKIVSASALHDVGKIGIRDAILLKPGKLTTDEFEEMKKHTLIGADFIRRSDNAWDEDYNRVSYEIARYHHEKFDGKGYPEGLKGNEIPISAQIVSIADVYDALVNKRCYKEAFAKEKAFDMVLKGECGQFNPDLLDCFIDTIDEFEELAEILRD